jgi:hypothetical protein
MFLAYDMLAAESKEKGKWRITLCYKEPEKMCPRNDSRAFMHRMRLGERQHLHWLHL